MWLAIILFLMVAGAGGFFWQGAATLGISLVVAGVVAGVAAPIVFGILLFWILLGARLEVWQKAREEARLQALLNRR